MTIKDVAEKAGVSMITVSRVINNPQMVSEPTREKKYKILNECGYTHNTAAHNLASNRSGIICVFASKNMPYQDPFFQQFLVGIGVTLSKYNYSLQIVNEIRSTQFCDGYILMGYNYSEHSLEDAKKTGKPVAIFSSYKDDSVDVMDTDNIVSSKKLVEYLIGRGHRKIAIVLNSVRGTYVEDRLSGYKEALKENGIEYDDSLVTMVENSMQGGIEAASWYDGIKDKATAVFLITDILAVGFVIGAKTLGMEVPGDVSVVGYDGLGHHLMSSPKITTMAQPIYSIAQDLTKCLLERIKNPKKKPVYELMEGTLDEEESTRNI